MESQEVGGGNIIYWHRSALLDTVSALKLCETLWSQWCISITIFGAYAESFNSYWGCREQIGGKTDITLGKVICTK